MNEKEALTGLKNLSQIFKLCSENDVKLKDFNIMNPKAYKEAIETLLNHLTKQEKMIELMAEHISFGKDIRKILCSPKVHGKDDCIGITCKRCIKQYFEKKAEETE